VEPAGHDPADLRRVVAEFVADPRQDAHLHSRCRVGHAEGIAVAVDDQDLHARLVQLAGP
jgi:hypothetical protein